MLEESVSLWASMFSWFTPTVLFVFLNLMIGTIAITSSLATNTKCADEDNNQQLGRSPSVLQRLRSINFHSNRTPEPVANFVESPGLQTHTPEPHDPNHQPQPLLSRSPSMMQRLRSFNLYNYISNEQNISPSGKQHDSTHQKREDPEQEELEDESPTIDEIYSKLKGGQENNVARTKSDTEPASGTVPPKLPKKMRKSASTKSPFNHFEEDDVVEARRPATVKEGKPWSRMTEEEGFVDEQVDARAENFINSFKQRLKMQRMDSILRYKESVKKGASKA